MKLNIVPARTGITWVKQGIRTFFRQPLALSGLFFMFMALMSLTTLVPVVGSALALGLLPAATLGLMAATKEVEGGKFPMPTVLATAFRAGRERMNAMLVLGALYALGFVLIMGISAAFDGGTFACGTTRALVQFPTPCRIDRGRYGRPIECGGGYVQDCE